MLHWPVLLVHVDFMTAILVGKAGFDLAAVVPASALHVHHDFVTAVDAHPGLVLPQQLRQCWLQCHEYVLDG